MNIYSFAKVSFEIVRISSFLRSRSGKKEDEYSRAQLLGVGAAAHINADYTGVHLQFHC